MTAPVLSLATALTTKLNELTGKQFIRRYAPFYESKDIESGKWLVLAAAEEYSQVARSVGRTIVSVDVGYQVQMPPANNTNPDPLANLTFLDGCLNEVESVKALFKEGGPLQSVSFSDFVFKSMSNSPIYRTDILIEQQIFISVIRLDFEVDN